MIAPAHFRGDTKSMGIGRHRCCFYETEEDRRSLLSTLHRQGLEQNQHTVYLLDSRVAPSICPGSSKTASPIDRKSVHPGTSVIQADQSFVPDELISSLSEEIERAKSERGLDLQVICQMPCPRGAHASAGRLMEFESKLDLLALSNGCTCTCLYAATGVDSALLVGIMSAHPTVIIKGERCENLYYIPPLQASEIGRPAATLHRRLENLTARKRLEKALRESEARFRSLVEPNIIGIISTGGDIITDANDAFLTMAGYTREELVQGKLQWTELVAPEHRQLDKARVEELYTKGTCAPFETKCIRKAGARVPVLVGASLLGRNPLRTVCFVLDITERKKEERAQQFLTDAGTLLASSLDYETTLQSVLHSAVPFLADWCVVDIVEQGMVQRVAISSSDPSIEDLLRDLARLYSQHLDRHPAGCVLASSKPELCQDVTDSFLKRISFDARHLETLRSMAIKSIISVPLVARGGTFGVITFATGESGRRYGPADLSLAEELARRASLAVDNARLYRESQIAIQARDEFLSAASHELKTPITSLRGFAQLTVRRLSSNGAMDPHQLRRAIEVIDQQSDRLARLVDQLLDVSRIQSGQLSLDRQITDIRSLVTGLVNSAQEHSLRHTLTLRAPSELPVFVDPLRLEQVVTNLIDNAIKYSPDGGAIDVDLSAPGSDLVQLSVTDNGIGISPEHRQRIFDRFYQAHTDGHYGGIGMGLYISSQIVTLHGGRIEVECPPEGGARFVVSLPTNFSPRGL